MTTRRRFIEFMPLSGAAFLAACGEKRPSNLNLLRLHPHLHPCPLLAVHTVAARG